MDSVQTTKMDLEKEFQSLVKSANNLINAANTALDSTTEGARSFVESVSSATEGMDLLKKSYSNIEGVLATGIRKTDGLVRKHPYIVLGAAVAAALAVTYMMKEEE